MPEREGLVWAMDVDPAGRATPIGWAELDTKPTEGFRWIHLEHDAPDALDWLRERSGLSELEIEALSADATRPRTSIARDDVLLILRGVNLNPGADPEDMVSVRVRADAHQVISVWRRRLIALEEVRGELLAGRGPRNVGDFLARLAGQLIEPMTSALIELEEALDAVEENAPDASSGQRAMLNELRRQAIALRRYLAPQRDALLRLSTERVSWLGDLERLRIREVLDHTMRIVEDLEAARERAAVTQEELATRLADQLNRRMYALSVIAGVFLPLSFLTGLLGINVAGIPGAETPWAFVAVCGALGVVGIEEFALFRRLGWL